MIDGFVRALEAAGYEPVRPVHGDTNGRFERLRYLNEKRSSGRYRLIVDGERAIAMFGSDKDPNGFQTWRSWDGKKLSDADYEQAIKWQRQKRAEMEKREKVLHDRAARRFTRLWSSSFKKVPIDHPYLVAKEIDEAENIKYRPKTGEIIVPCICPIDGRIYSLQKITEQGDKIFVRGGRVKGTFCPLAKTGESNKRFYVCEGYATGMTIRKATGVKTFVAFNANNLKPVAEGLRGKYPEAEIIIAGDNDKWQSEKWPANKEWVNTGVKKGGLAAGAVGGWLIVPEFPEEFDELKLTDWNDYASVIGINRVNELLSAVAANKAVEKSELVAGPPFAATKSASSSSSPFKIDETNWGRHLRWKDGAEGTIFDKRYSLHNAIIYLSYDPLWVGTFVFDEFQQIERVVKPLPWDDGAGFHWRDITDSDKTQLRSLLLTRGITIGSNTEMHNVLQSVARKKTVHPVRDYFESMEWDGKPRLNTWLIDYCEANTQPREYIEAVGSCFIKASVARVFNPGEPFHHMMVLEGKQAAGKSSLLKTLATFNDVSYFTDGISFDHIGKDHMAQFLRGKLIIEFAELSGLSAKDRNKVKSWITMDADELQPKFSNDIVRLPRQFVLAGTTNDESWLNDPTGGRRFWPVQVGKIDVQAVARVNEQLWAEAVHRYKAGEMHYIPDNSPVYKQAMAQQSERLHGHVWEDQIAHYLETREQVTIDDVLIECLNVPRGHWKNSHKQDIGDILRKLGYENKSLYDRRSGKQVRRWVRS